MMTNPTLDDLLEGLIVSLENEIMPHVSSPKAHVMCQMVQSLIQVVIAGCKHRYAIVTMT
jgi:hypothetical protein